MTVALNKSGKKVINGRGKSLKHSAEYPIQFGYAIAALIAPFGTPSRSLDQGWVALMLTYVNLQIWFYEI